MVNEAPGLCCRGKMAIVGETVCSETLGPRDFDTVYYTSILYLYILPVGLKSDFRPNMR